MYCHSCGIELPENFRYCSQCGTTTGVAGFAARSADPGRILSRPREGAKIAGVCAGLARHLNIDVTLVRVLIVCLAILPPSAGLIFYVVCWIVMPRDPLPLAANGSRTEPAHAT